MAWYYDNLGALVTHGVVEVEPVFGYLGGSVISVWERIEPLVTVERARRMHSGLPDPDRWQQYLISTSSPRDAPRTRTSTDTVVASA
ncbi:hypothetical protein AQJ66_24460 [Streptomyces bungoensis]|uniref:Uncharacterized protein n=2 Tax=Streptomyces bungoensis TaxID=285568 RepID=A0A117RB60_9ACTN|nr:hypothetical protein [Streptomyces bungoensis]KUN81119.1 hypothetical protein AQJ66_24460 [Streptomyces bungoensis]